MTTPKVTFVHPLEDTLHRALGAAQSRGHEYATIEHLLLALLDDPHAAEALLACGADISALRATVEAYIDKELEALTIGPFKKKRKTKADRDALERFNKEGPSPTSGFQRIVQRGILHVQSSGRSEVNGANVLVALFSERESYACHFLAEQNITRLDVVNWISKGVSKPSRPTGTVTDSAKADAIRKILRDDLRPLPDSVAEAPVLATPRIAEKIVEFSLDLVTQSALASAGDAEGHALITVGIFGPWGSGKSTLLTAIASRLGAEGVTPVFINTWKWDGAEDIFEFVNRELLSALWRTEKLWVAAILIRALLVARANSRRLLSWLVMGTGLAVLAASIDWQGSVISSELAKGSLLAVVSGALVALFAKPLGSFVERAILQESAAISGREALTRSYRYLEATRRLVSRKKHAPVAFLFDDLDRCGTDRVVDFFKSIHTLTSSGSICVVACDEEFAVAAIQHHFKDVAAYLKGGSSFGARFLEKMIQVPFRLPEISVEDLRMLAIAPLPEDEASASVEASPKGAPELSEPRPEHPSPDLGGPQTTPVSEIRLSQICGDVLALLVEPCNLHIRQIKLLFNIVKLYSMIFPPEDESAARRMAAFLAISYVDPDWIEKTYFGAGHLENKSHSRLDDLAPTLKILLGDDPAILKSLHRLFGAGRGWNSNPTKPDTASQEG
jgi:hypothetical protein